MQGKVLFMVFENEIKFMQSENADYWKWYQSLGGDPYAYDNVIRGFISDGNIIFFKTNYTTDDEVVKAAIDYGPLIKQHLNIENAHIFCGLERSDTGGMKPSKIITEEDINNFKIQKEKAIQEEQERIEKEQYAEQTKMLQQRSTKDDIIQFNNNYQDDDFSKYAVTFTTIILIATLISKLYLVSTKKLFIDNRWNALLLILQIVSLVASIYFYKKKDNNAKTASLAATIFLFATFNLPDIVIAVFNLFFTVDQKYIQKFMEYVDKAKNKSGEEINKIKEVQESKLNEKQRQKQKEIEIEEYRKKYLAQESRRKEIERQKALAEKKRLQRLEQQEMYRKYGKNSKKKKKRS